MYLRAGRENEKPDNMTEHRTKVWILPLLTLWRSFMLWMRSQTTASCNKSGPELQTGVQKNRPLSTLKANWLEQLELYRQATNDRKCLFLAESE